ncbi:DUF6118 family protein [Sphingomonas sp. AOB5]|uniref:DUF6118 family protein n=1 Tax=Sphingomonas sp. AOB5 TaxID=3034017 RepID=UPI0023F72043|nr:DUF6118 family protein [Sphingomonas sp. AOB5]MDF7773781.1 DUF6118 family protein [Sphingomonas sp. AOB5]
MDEESTREVGGSLAAHAFGELRAEVSLMRRAVERLTDERTSQPDYAPSLEEISRRMEKVVVWAGRIAQQPAMQLTPEGIGRDIAGAASTSREQDRQMLQNAASGMDAAAGRIDAALARARSAAEQDRALLRNRVAFAIAGMMLWAILPGVVVRALPESWAVPERMAARTVGKNMWHAGQQMMAKGDPQRWERLVARGRPDAQLRGK